MKSTGGDTRLGGEDFDTAVVAWAVGECQKKYKVNPSSSARSMRRLQTACERAKRSLSSAVSTVIEVDSLFEGVDFNVTLSRYYTRTYSLPVGRVLLPDGSLLARSLLCLLMG